MKDNKEEKEYAWIFVVIKKVIFFLIIEQRLGKRLKVPAQSNGKYLVLLLLLIMIMAKMVGKNLLNIYKTIRNREFVTNIKDSDNATHTRNLRTYTISNKTLF